MEKLFSITGLVVIIFFLGWGLAKYSTRTPLPQQQTSFGSPAPVQEEPSHVVDLGSVIEPLSSKHNVDGAGNAAFGISHGNGVHIIWNGLEVSNGVGVEDVLELAAERLQHLQGTPQSSDQQAKALFEVLEAIDVLQGTNTVTAPVGPGFNPNMGE